MALIATAAAVSIAPAGAQATVCNQATEGQRGDLVAQGTPDPRPPARHQTDLAALPGKGAGLETAAERSPALTQCGPVGGGGEDPPPVLTGGNLAT